MSPVEALRSALDALRANVLRSALTMLGIIIGVTAVIVMVAVGSGARAKVMQQIQSLGSNLIIVVSGSMTSGGVRMGVGSRWSLSEEDGAALARDVPSIQVAVGTVRGSAQIVAGNTNWSTVVLGVGPGYLEARDWELAAGRDFTAQEFSGAGKVILLGETVVKNLFGEGVDPVGQIIRVRATPFTVTGVLARKGQNTQGQDQDDVVVVPVATAKQKVLGSSRANARAVAAMLVKVRDGEDMADAERQMREVLRQRHRLTAAQDDDFWIRNLTEVANTQLESSKALALLLAAVAGVSLLVGGIGIMNIMLVSVTERTREIGLRLAVGARRRDILSQFLIEATTLAAIGGAIGVVLGVGGSIIVAELGGWPTLINPEVVLAAVGFSALIGVFFGFYPAQRASHLDPIEALRHE
ncbi:MAG: ABC transporter permease [Alphaproteobacteria bacterium]|nr:ABC transporter permease [Alphaproteobacteria bacterium]